MDWRNLMKQSVTVGAQLLWGGRYGCNNGRYGCTIVMSYIEINKAVSQWLLTFNLCVSVTWPLTCEFHIPCTHTPEIIDMHRGVCDNSLALTIRRESRKLGLCVQYVALWESLIYACPETRIEGHYTTVCPFKVQAYTFSTGTDTSIYCIKLTSCNT